MNVENCVYPEADQTAELQRPGPDGPIVMVNLLKFRDQARYRDGRDPELSGRDAYHRYAAGFITPLRAAGGRILFVGDVTFLSLGRVESLWDEVAVVEYPSRAAFAKMTTAAEWREISIHREAGLAGQLNIETTPSFVMKALAER